MDTTRWQGMRWTDRWQQCYGQIRDGRWGDVLARLERRDLELEAHLGRLPQLISRGLVRANAGLTLTGSKQDISGCSVDLTLQVGDVVEVAGIGDITVTSANGLGVVVLEVTAPGVSAVEQTGQIIFGRPNPSRGTAGQNWDFTATKAGVHTFKLRGVYAAAGASVAATHTTMRWKVWR